MMKDKRRINYLFLTLLALCSAFAHAVGAAAPVSHDNNAAHSDSTSHGVSAANKHMPIPADVVLSDPETNRILGEKHHLPEKPPHLDIERPRYSNVLTIVILNFIGVLCVLGYFVISGAFARYKLGVKLALGFGIMVVLAAMLGISNQMYMMKLDDVSHYSIELLELEEVGSEQHIAQDEFLLYGLEDPEYGKVQLDHLRELMQNYETRTFKLANSGWVQEDEKHVFTKLADHIVTYERQLDQVVDAYHEIEQGKEELEKQGKYMANSLEKMFHHHEEMLLALEDAGGPMSEIKKQTIILKHLEMAEISSLKTTIEEVSFLIDKKPERIERMEDHMGLYIALLEVLTLEIEDPRERAQLAQLQAKTDSYINWLKLIIKDEAKIKTRLNDMSTTLAESRYFTADLAHMASDQVYRLEKEGQVASMILTICTILTGIGLAYYVARSIHGPLDTVSRSLAQGAELADSVSRQVSSGSQTLAEGASSQAAALAQTSASLNNIANSTRRNSENAERANALAKETYQAADQGGKEMDTMSKAMDDIQSSSDEISNIIKTIDDIAFQTNILALNAAVEAARAGEAGAGFAVVADEVRNLAQRSAVAAKETSQKIEDAIQKSSQGVAISKRMTESLETIVEKAGKVDELLNEITTASSEQNEGVGQVNQAVNQVESVTQSNAASAEETASASAQLSAQATDMRNIVSRLNEVISGNGGNASQNTSVAAHTPPAPPSTGSGESGFTALDDDWDMSQNTNGNRQNTTHFINN